MGTSLQKPLVLPRMTFLGPLKFLIMAVASFLAAAGACSSASPKATKKEPFGSWRQDQKIAKALPTREREHVSVGGGGGGGVTEER